MLRVASWRRTGVVEHTAW